MKQVRILALAASLILAGPYATGAQAAASGISSSFGLNHGKLQISAPAPPTVLAGGQAEAEAEAGRPSFRDGHDRRSLKEQQGMDMPPRMEELRQKREALRAELEALPPEKRKAKMEELRSQYREKREERRAAFREEFKKRWDGASAEERAVFCDKARMRCEGGGARACDFVGKTCGEK